MFVHRTIARRTNGVIPVTVASRKLSTKTTTNIEFLRLRKAQMLEKTLTEWFILQIWRKNRCYTLIF